MARKNPTRQLLLERLDPRRLLHAGPTDGPSTDWPPVEGVGEGEGTAGQVPNFALIDTNATSPTAGQSVSPRDFLGQISGWYFGHAT